MKRTLTMLLVLLMLLSSFAGCNTKKNADGAQSTTAQIEAETDAQTEEKLDPELEAEDFGGTYSILGREAEDYSFPYFELDGNASKTDLDSKIFRRNRYIEDKYNIQLLSYYEKTGQLLTKATTDVLAGADHEYDTYLVPTTVAFQMATHDLLQPLEEIPHINLEKAYYDQSLKSDTSIANKHYFVHGHFSISTYNAVSALYLNKTMVSSYDLNDPYALVESGAWTWEQMFEMCKVTTNIVEDGEANVGQHQYGISIGVYAWQPLFFSTGSSLVTKDENDMPVLQLNKCLEVIQDINRVMNDSATTFFPSSYSVSAKFNAMQIFQEGRSLFMSDPLYCVPQYLLDCDVDYGILPLPKYIESQQTYYSQTHAAQSTVIAVPTVMTDLNKVGKIIEDYAYQSSITVHPVIMDTMIRLRNAQTEKDYAMLDIIFASVRCDMGLAMSKEMKIDGDVRDLIKKNSTAIASTLQSKLEEYQGAMDKVVTAWIT